MNKVQQLIEDYRKEYERVNGRVPAICRTSAKSLWIEVDRNFYRIGEIREMLAILKTRKGYYDAPQAT